MLKPSASNATDTCGSDFGLRFSRPSSQTNLQRTRLKNCFRFNTLFYILQKQRPDLTLRVCHRLDRLTSGLTILAKTAERAGVIQTQIGVYSWVLKGLPVCFLWVYRDQCYLSYQRHSFVSLGYVRLSTLCWRACASRTISRCQATIRSVLYVYATAAEFFFRVGKCCSFCRNDRESCTVCMPSVEFRYTETTVLR